MAKRGRKNKYETHVKPKLDYIQKRISEGATEEMVCEELGVGVSNFNRYKQDFEELREILKKAKQNVVSEVRGALVKRALGFSYEEKKTYVKTDENGCTTTYQEVAVKYALPDTGACLVLLKHLDVNEDGSAKWTSDLMNMQLKKREIELKEKQAEENSW